MNTKISFILIFIICSFAAYGEAISHSVRINPDDVVLADTIVNGVSYVLPEINGVENQAEPGQPSLPRVFVTFALPPNAKDISIANVTEDMNLPDYKYSTQKDIVMCSYLENGVFTMKKPVIIDHRTRVYKSKGADSYRPLLEEGKEWRYTMYNPINRAFPDYRPGPIEVNRVIRLENPIEIDGETYLQANAYYDGEHQHDEYNPIICLREDIMNKKVIMKRYPEDHFYADHYTGGMYLPLWENNGNDTLYNFINPLASLVANSGKSAVPNEFECLDGQHKGFDMELYTGDFSMIEGVGLVHKEIDRTCDLFGFACSQLANLPDWCYYPYLYEVANADGTVIYRNPDFAPGWTSVSSVISDRKITVDIKDGVIKVRCPNDTTDECLYNLQGIRVTHTTCTSGEVSLPATGLTSGVYILQCGEYIQKVTL